MSYFKTAFRLPGVLLHFRIRSNAFGGVPGELVSTATRLLALVDLAPNHLSALIPPAQIVTMGVTKGEGTEHVAELVCLPPRSSLVASFAVFSTVHNQDPETSVGIHTLGGTGSFHLLPCPGGAAAELAPDIPTLNYNAANTDQHFAIDNPYPLPLFVLFGAAGTITTRTGLVR